MTWTYGRTLQENYRLLQLQVKPPILNQIITQDWTNGMAVTGTGDDRCIPPSVPVPVTTAIGDPLLSGYTPVTGVLSNPSVEYKMSMTDGVISMEELGKYSASGFINFIHTQNNATIAFVYSLESNGNYYFSARPVRQKVPNNDGVASLSGVGMLPITDTSQKIRLWICSDKTGTITSDTASIIIKRESAL